MATLRQEVVLTYTTITCSVCGVIIALPGHLEQERRRDHKAFYCPNGHNQYFPGESDLEKLKKQLEQETKKKEWAQREVELANAEQEKLRRKLKRQEKRARGGVCPCCTRTFTNLRRHMETKHPEHGT